MSSAGIFLSVCRCIGFYELSGVCGIVPSGKAPGDEYVRKNRYTIQLIEMKNRRCEKPAIWDVW